MKNTIVALLLCATFSAFSQTQQKTETHYLQLTAAVSNLQYIEMLKLPEPKKTDKYTPYVDPQVNTTYINAIITQYKFPVPVLNELGKDGWVLVSTASVTFDPKTYGLLPGVIYYLKKDIVK